MIRQAARYGGLIVPPALWAAQTQLGLLLPHVDCRDNSAWSLAASLCAIALMLACAWVSHRMARQTQARMPAFLGELSFLVGLAFAFASLLQGAAAWLLDPCLT